MKKRFLVFIDFSDYSRWLLTTAAAWAERAGAEVLLIHHSHSPVPGLGDSESQLSIKQSYVEDAEEKLKAFASEVLGDTGTLKFYGTTESLPHFVAKLDEPDASDFLFVGMKNKSLLEKIFVRGTAIDLSDNLDKVIIALPAMAEPLRFDNLYIAIRTRYRLNEPEFKNVLSLTADGLSRLHFFSVLKEDEKSDKTEAYLEDLESRFSDTADVSCAIRRSDDPFGEIKHYMEENGGVLVVQKGSRSVMDLFRKFFVSEIVYHARIPIIILP